MRPAIGKYASRLALVSTTLLTVMGASVRSLTPSRALAELQRLSAVNPVGLFDNRVIERAMRTSLSKRGRSNYLHELKGELFLLATDVALVL